MVRLVVGCERDIGRKESKKYEWRKSQLLIPRSQIGASTIC